MLVVSISIPKNVMMVEGPSLEQVVCQASHMSLSLSPCLLHIHLNLQTLWLYNHQDNGILLGYQIGVESIQVHRHTI